MARRAFGDLISASAGERPGLFVARRYDAARCARGGKMTQNPQFAVLSPLAVCVGAVACTIVVHALALAATVNLFRYERSM